MTDGRSWRGRAVYLLPLACAAVAALALFWALGLDGGSSAADEREQEEAGGLEEDEDASDDEGSTADGIDVETSEEVSGILSSLSSAAAGEATTETFLTDVEERAEEMAESSSDEVAVVSWEEEAGLVELAGSVLEAYEDLGDAALATSGYLDLQGNAWGAVVQGGSSWVDIVIITTEDDETSTARVVRLLPEDVGSDG